jgi:hypothetical protein
VFATNSKLGQRGGAGLLARSPFWTIAHAAVAASFSSEPSMTFRRAPSTVILPLGSGAARALQVRAEAAVPGQAGGSEGA